MEKSIHGKGKESIYFSVQSVKITFILFKFHRSIDNSYDFYLFILSWKVSRYQRIQSWNFQTSSRITNHLRNLSMSSIVRLLQNSFLPDNDVSLSLLKACVRYFSLFLKEQCVSWLFRTKYFEEKFNLQLFYLPTVSRTFIILSYNALPAFSKLLVLKK